MKNLRPMNFLPRINNIRLLKFAIGACLSVSVIMTWALIWEPSGSQKANISNNLSVNEPTSLTSELSGQTSPKAISDNPIVSAMLSPLSDTVQYYEVQTGKAFRVNINTRRTETISDKRLIGFVRAYWSSDGKQVVAAFEEQNGLALRYYDYTTGKNSAIGNSAISATFSPDGHNLAFLDNKGSSISLMVGGSDGTESREILTTRSNSSIIEWPKKDFISLLTQRTGSVGRDLSLVNLDGTLRILLSNRDNLEHVWSPSGQKLLFSYFVTGKGVQLLYLDITLGAPIFLNIATSAAKCAWQPDEQGIVCGVPASDSLTRDISADKTATLDAISQIDLVSGAINKLYSPQKGVLLGVGESLVSSSGNYFVFRNLFDQRLYVLTIE